MPANVYHAVNPTFGMSEQPQEFELVARVDTDNLDKAFELTNHIDCEWWKNEGVELVKESRSTSVGDVIEIDREWFQCANVGWVKFNPSCTK